MISYHDLTEPSASAVTNGARSVLLAGKAAAKAAMELGIGTPHIIWFTEAEPGTPNAYTRPDPMKGESRALANDIIWLHVGLDGDDLINTVAHECRHIWQFKRGALHALASFNSDNRYAVAEADARSFAEAFVAKFTGGPIPEKTAIAEKALEESPARLLEDLRAALAALDRF